MKAEFELTIKPLNRSTAIAVADFVRLLAESSGDGEDALVVESKKAVPAEKTKLSLKSPKTKEAEEDEEEEADEDREEEEEEKPQKKKPGRPAKKKDEEEEEEGEDDDDDDDDEGEEEEGEEEEEKPAKKKPGRPAVKGKEEKKAAAITIDTLRALYLEEKRKDAKKAKKVLEKFGITTLAGLSPKDYEKFHAALKK